METRANHLAVGLFVLLVVAGAFGFVLWLGKTEIDRKFDVYYVYFTGSVSGLTTASTVRYRGVPVGTVTDIRIDPENSERVRVIIELREGTPVKEDSVASLELQGITGVVNVEISGGSRDSPRLRPEPGKTVAVVVSKPSRLETLFENIPKALARFTRLMERGTLLLSDENIKAIGATLKNFESVSGAIADNSDDIKRLTTDVTVAAAEVRRTAEGINLLVQDLGTRIPGMLDDASSTLKAAEGAFTSVGSDADSVAKEGRLTLRELRTTAQSLSGAADEINAMVSENRQALRDFSGEGLFELTRFLVEARSLVASLTRISNRFEEDPARFLFGDSQQGFEPK
ncbi:MAG: MlaD family protein [Alphaproteobacteria bacterium]